MDSSDSSSNSDMRAHATNAQSKTGFGWFALGSLFGALLLFTSAVLATNGAVLESANPAAEAAQAARYKQAAREAISEVLASNPAAQVPAVAAQPGALGNPSVVNTQVNLRNVNIQGNANAPVTLIEFSDFQCPYCLRYHQETMPRIIEEYVKTGKVKIAFKQFPALGPASVVAAQASECAADQNGFWDYYNALYDYRAKNGRVPQTKDELIRVAGDMKKYDGAQFSNCLNSSATAARVNDDYEDAQRIGGRGTPTFLVNGKMVVGAQPYNVFKAAIDEALKKAG